MRSKNVRDIRLQFRNSFSGLTPLFKSTPHTVRHVCLVAAGVDKDDHGKDARKRSQIGRDNSRKIQPRTTSIVSAWSCLL